MRRYDSKFDTVRNVPTMSRRQSPLRRLSALGLGSAAVLLAGCAKNAPQDTWQPAGSNARMIDNLQEPVFLVAGIVGVIVFVAIGYALFKFRDRGQEMPEQSHGKPALEIGLTILPALILVGVGIPTVSTVFKLAKSSDTQCIVNVTGQQWWWEYDYPAQAGCGGIEKPIVTSGQLVIPAGQHVLHGRHCLHLASCTLKDAPFAPATAATPLLQPDFSLPEYRTCMAVHFITSHAASGNSQAACCWRHWPSLCGS
jgi:hypothetical protein